MHSYIIYIGISHIDQLTKLYPDLVQQISQNLDKIAFRFGGCLEQQYLYRFQNAPSESVRRTAEAACAMQSMLQQRGNDLYGTTVLVGRGGDEFSPMEDFESLILHTSDDNRMWLAPSLQQDFKTLFNLSDFGEIMRIDSLKDVGLRLEERLPKLLIRHDKFNIVKRILETMEKKNIDNRVLLIRGKPGSGKRATLFEALRQLYPDDGGASVILPCSDRYGNPMEPFSRAVMNTSFSVEDYLNQEEVQWWHSTGSKLIQKLKQNKNWESVSDQQSVDVVHAYSLYFKAFSGSRYKKGRPAYIIFDGLNPGSESVVLLRSILTELIDEKGFRLIIIRDSSDYSEDIPLPGMRREVGFDFSTSKAWVQVIKDASIDDGPGGRELKSIADQCAGNLYKLFHMLLNRESGIKLASNSCQTLVETLSAASRTTLFLAFSASGMITRELIIQRFSDTDDQIYELGRINELLSLGLIHEEQDGRIRSFPDADLKIPGKNSDYLKEAENFGRYLYQLYESGNPIDPLHLYHYLAIWGPINYSIVILDRLLDSLITQRNLKLAGKLLNDTHNLSAKLDGKETDLLQSILSNARMRLNLLSGDIDKAFNHSGKTSGLHDALYSYSVGNWKNALSTSKEALFEYQKAGNHKSETYAHIELALALLALGNVREALEHFSIAHRIGTQIGATWGVLRAAALETVAQFIFGNLSKCAQECRLNCNSAQKEKRVDLWLLLTLIELRIFWETGAYSNACSIAIEGCKVAEFYSLTAEHRVMTIWKGRCLLAQNDSNGRRILEQYRTHREALAFLAEHAWLNGNSDEAIALLHLATEKERHSVKLQGEADDWSDGYFPIEGRLADMSTPLDVLGEQIVGMKSYFLSCRGETENINRLESLLKRGGHRSLKPFSYQYALWAALGAPKDETAFHTRHISRAFNDLQTRAGRIDDSQTKHAWLNANHWNKLLMDEAQRRRFL